MLELKTTRSLCPVCLKPISAKLIEKNSQIFMQKSCSEHGDFEDLYYSDSELYSRLMKEGNGSAEPEPEFVIQEWTQNQKPVEKKKSPAVIGIIDVTNRCNLDCTICFASCNTKRIMYEPSIEEIGGMMDALRNQDPPCPIALFSGGEPTVRKDFLDICNLAHQKGFTYIIVATNGKKLAEDPDYHRKLCEAHVDIIYLQFDGVTPDPYEKLRGKNLLPMKMKVFENIENSPRRYPFVVLVPTIAKGINDHQIGDMLRFATTKINYVKGILFQPIGFVGEVKDEELLNSRITNADAIQQLANSYNGEIDKNDFLPVVWIKDFLDAYKRIHNRNDVIDISTHPACFTVSYLIRHKDSVIPINRVIDLPELRKFVRSVNGDNQLEIAKNFAKIFPKILKKGSLKMAPQLFSVLKDIFFSNTADAIAKFHEDNVLLIGFEHTIDAYNYDCSKVEKCCISYSIPGDEIVPFCSYNLLHRKDTETNFKKSF